ncbi:OmpA family protein [Haliangium sp.]|uniref:OmpA family protein n=1 Tax=Haliangium sp. TaxID=2663208 RepID=UPI003D1164B7
MLIFPRFAVLTILSVAAIGAGPARAQPAPGGDDGDAGYWELGASLGAHTFSARSPLGAIAEDGPSLSSSVVMGLRLGYVLSPVIAIEGELPVSPTTSRDTDPEAFVAVITPRLQARLGGGTVAGFEPFATLGLGLPVSLSSDSSVITNDLLADVQAGAGVRLPRDGGWSLRFEVRSALLPARGVDLATFEFELLAGLYYTFGRAPSAAAPAPAAEVADSDGDGVVDDADRCPDRDEDHDGFEDGDGCPDIDDDRDEVLDEVDQCRMAPERVNGYRDNDGCPDEIPAALRALAEDDGALHFRAGSERLARGANARAREIAEVLAQYSAVKLVVVGHAGPREADTPDQADDLSRRRAEAARALLVELGVDPRRLEIWAHGARRPVTTERRDGARNRRVTIHVLVPGVPVAEQLDRLGLGAGGE